MDLTLIPFGLSVQSEQLVDVYEVEGGRQCQCVCPSCRLPLIARHGSINVWHFAHETREAKGTPATPCEYSFYLSVRMMARQLLESNMSIDVPELRGEVVEIVRRTGQAIRQPYLVTDARTLYLEKVMAGEKLEDIVVDIMGMVDGYKFALYLTDPERSVPAALARPTEKKCGVVSLRLDDVRNRFRSCDRSSETYKSILTKYLSVGTFSKKWIYHPRQQSVEEAAKAEARLKLQQVESDIQARSIRRRSAIADEAQTMCRAAERRIQHLWDKQYRHYCLLCGHQWSSTLRGNESLHCPSCGKRGCIS